MTKLGDLVIDGGIQTGPFGSQLHASDYTSHGVGVVMPQDIGDNLVVPDSMARIDPTMAESLSRHQLVPGDIVFSRRGDVTRRALIRSEDGELLCGTGCLRVRLDRKRADASYVSYSLALRKTRDWLVRHAVGVTMPNLNTGILSEVPLPVPELYLQQAVGRILGAFDAKTVANMRANSLLSELIAARSMVFRESRSSQGYLGDILRLNYGRALPVARRRDGEVAVVGSGGVVGFHDEALVAGPCVVLGRKGSVGATYWVDGPAYPIDTTYWVEPINVPLVYAFTTLNRIDFSGLSTDSAVPGLNRERAYSIPLTIPSMEDLLSFEDFVAPLLERAAATRDENQRLAATRDELLPLLMSGKITVKDAEKTVEEVV